MVDSEIAVHTAVCLRQMCTAISESLTMITFFERNAVAQGKIGLLNTIRTEILLLDIEI